MRVRRRIAILAIAISCACVPLGAQTTVIQTIDGATSQISIPPDGSGNALVFTQTVVAPPAGTPATQGVVGGVTFGGPPPVPARDQPGAMPKGTARIRGTVTAADTGRPVRRATVRLSAPGIRESRSTSTDQDGHYEFIELAAASYTISASRSGFVATSYKQPRPRSAGQPVVLGDRETRERVDISLFPAAVITGRIVDEFGEPVSDVMVSAQRQQFVNGARRPLPVGSPSSTNDIGEFRVHGLGPGAYYVLATPRTQAGPFDVNADRTGYAATYYPAAADPADAQRLTVASGQTVSDIVITLSQTRVARVSGTVFDAEGRPARNGTVMVSSTSRGFGLGPNGNAFVRPDGSFVVSGLSPGEYVLRSLPVGNFAGPTLPNVAIATVAVNGADISNVVLSPQPPVSLTGRLTGDPATLAQIKPSTTRLMAMPLSLGIAPPPPAPPQQVHDDLTFEVFAYPGEVAIRPGTLQGLAIRSVRLNSRDVTKGFTVDAGTPISDLEVELTALTARVTVGAVNSRSEPVSGFDVIVFPQEEADWGLQMPGHVASGRTDQDGTFRTPPLVAGSYYVAAADTLELGDSADPEILAELRTRAQRVTIRDGETANVQLKAER